MKVVDPQEVSFTHQRIRPTSPGPITKKLKRPWRGIFLAFFLFSCSILFFSLGVERYDTFTGGELAVVIILALLLMIPGAFFGVIIVMTELRVKGFSYTMMPQLQQW